jgi:restriction endonuclease S subunit|tara:strand:+ start:508 stop:768 length:261 start_codon:yes stop_codon:yes gene_type:complete
MKLDSNEKTNQLPKTFYVTYYANKHKAIITRKGQWNKPDTDTVGKYFVSNAGYPCFIYWDLDATPNKNGNQWRQATGMITIKSADV